MSAKQIKRYIVSHYIFAEHASWADAEAERQRLAKKEPTKKFNVYCILEKFENYEDMPIKTPTTR
jgi:hypothetical protein